MKQLLKHKELILELAFRDLKLQYQRPFLGFLWMLIIPFSTAFIYKLLFSDFLQATSGKYPFFIHLITALLPWNYFAFSISRASRCILDSKNIINQLSFPKYLLPLSTVLVNLINFLPSLLVLPVFLVIFKVKPSIFILALPLVILIQTLLIIGLSLLVSSLQVIYRDVEYFIQVLLMVLFFSTPAVYTLDDLISRFGQTAFTKIYMLNPLVGITNLYRIAFMGGYLESLPGGANLFNTLISPLLWSAVVLAAGCFVFKACEKRFFDYLNI